MIGPMRTVAILAIVALAGGCDSNGGEPDGGSGDGGPDGALDGDTLPTEGLVGHPCTADEDCMLAATSGRVTCLRRSWGFRDGYCTIIGARDDGECETADPDAAHVALPCARAVCMRRCELPEDCRDGYECQPVLQACWPRCEAGRACPVPPPNVCEFDAECDDGDPCTEDGCVDGVCAYDRVTEQPRRVARLATLGAAVDVDFTGTLSEGNMGLLVAEGADGVEAIDLGNPSSPALAFRLETTGRAVAVVRQGDRIAVAEETTGVELFPAGGGSAVGLVALADGVGSAVGLTPQNSFVYGYRHGAFYLDVAGAGVSAPCDTRGRATDGAWFGADRVLLVADSLAGLAICSWPEAGGQTQLDRVDTLGRLLAVAVRDTVLAAAEAGAGVGIFDVTDPRNPARRETTAPLAGEAVDVRMTGPSTLVAAASAGGIYAFALEDCFVPELWYRWETDGPALALDEQDGVLAVALGEAGVELLDLGCRTTEPEE